MLEFCFLKPLLDQINVLFCCFYSSFRLLLKGMKYIHGLFKLNSVHGSISSISIVLNDLQNSCSIKSFEGFSIFMFSTFLCDIQCMPHFFSNFVLGYIFNPVFQSHYFLRFPQNIFEPNQLLGCIDLTYILWGAVISPTTLYHPNLWV
jgi:uncharacterized protein YebE (UPF0316 family)